jgi:hypothetical protein
MAKQLILFLIIIVQCGCSPQLSHTEWRALSRIRGLYNAMYLAMRDHGDDIDYNEISDWDRMILFLVDHTLAAKGYPINIDIWGNEMRYIMLPDNLGYPLDERLYVWSIGPNGINEFGHGDDISYFERNGQSYINGKLYIYKEPWWSNLWGTYRKADPEG